MSTDQASSKSSEAPTTTDVSRAISATLWKIHELEAILASYDGSNSEILEQRLLQYEKLLASSRDMLKLRPAPTADGSPPRNTLEGRKAPEELIKALDGGMNPDEYLRETFRAAKRDNQISKGKAEALQLLFANLLAEATATFPVEAAEYKKLLGLE